MLRSTTSVLALLAAMTLPAFAADYDDWGNDMGGSSALREGYPTEPKDWSDLGDGSDPVSFEVGTRYWYSMGAMSASAGSASVGTADITHIGELHLRVEDHSTNTYAKAMIGYSIMTSGVYATSSSAGAIADGYVGYAGGDFGWNLVGDNNGSGAGVLVGYQFWREALNSGRNNFTSATSAGDIAYDQNTGQTFVPLDSAPNGLDIHALRLGIQGKAKLGQYFDVQAEVAAVPYAHVSGSVGIDSASFSTAAYGGAAQAPYGASNGNISSIRASSTALDGWGYGAMAEGWLGVHPTENMTVRLGGRAWYLQGTANATYTRATIGNPGDSDLLNPPNFDTEPSFSRQTFINQSNPFSLLRIGVLGEVTYSF